MSERGVFAVDRGVFDHPSFAPEPFTQREAWTWLIGEAAFKPVLRRVGAVTVSLTRGQVAHSLRFMADKWQWSEPKVRRFLVRLKTDAMVLVATDAGVTVITICNYTKYQRVSLPRDAAIDAPNDAGPTQDRRKEEDTKYLNDDLDAGARSLVSEAAFEVATEIGKLCGHPDAQSWPPGWMGAPMRVQAWLTAGWLREQIIPACQEAVARKRDGPPSSINYFDKPIASFIAKQSAPLPKVEIRKQETVSVVRSTKTTGIIEAQRKHIASKIEFGPRPSLLRSGEGGSAIRMLPEGGRERSGDLHGGDHGDPVGILPGGDPARH